MEVQDEQQTEPRTFSRHEYADPEFWDKRFESQPTPFDWYAEWPELSPIVQRHCETSDRTLMVGCGNSKLSAAMHRAGFKYMTNIDLSSVVIDQMKAAYAELPMDWLVMDATNMDFDPEAFDVLVDKGTFDAVMCEPDDAKPLARALVREMCRVLNVGGRLVEVTHAQHRQAFFEEVCPGQWELEEVQKCGLSASATLVNILRSKLDGAPLADAMKNPALLVAAIKEYQDVQRAERLQRIEKAGDAPVNKEDAKKYLVCTLKDILRRRKERKAAEADGVVKSADEETPTREPSDRAEEAPAPELAEPAERAEAPAPELAEEPAERAEEAAELAEEPAERAEEAVAPARVEEGEAVERVEASEAPAEGTEAAPAEGAKEGAAPAAGSGEAKHVYAPKRQQFVYVYVFRRVQ